MRVMARSMSEDYGAAGGSSSVDSSSSMQHCQSVESLAEWRSCEQVENGTPSTSPLFWDTDDDDDSGPKPSDLFGKFTWKIENFSQISKRELRSNAFEVGGYKWYILIYPQGCDVCNHLSLFLCVANHDKLLPGWSHFAQFTISVVNQDPKKSKYSDTLHRFWKKEHDWGWKKFMELSKVLDGFIVDDALTIKAQVQVIREKAHRPFRCLDCHYRRELIRVYVSNVEQICRRFVEERRGKLSKLIEDKVKWSSFRAFWLGIDQNARRRMSRDRTDTILKVVVKHFFIEKEVTSTLVMDSLYSGLRALEYQSKKKKGRAKLQEKEEFPASMVCVEKDMFVLADDVFLLLERAALEPLPHQPLPPKDDKGLQNRTKDGSSGDEFNRVSIERDERRLTELGRRTVEIFVLAHIFSSRIEVAYQEAVALKRQEELIREEEAAGQAESELRARRGASEKEKRTKKKQAKQRRNNRKGKDRGKDEKSDEMMNGKHQHDSPSDERILEDFSSKQAQPLHEKIDTRGDASDVSDIGDDGAEALQPDLDDRDTSPLSWDTDASEIHPATEASSSEMQNGQMEKKSPSCMDDSSSTCSTDSVPSVVLNGPYKGNSSPNNNYSQTSNRGKDQRNKDMRTGSISDAGRLFDATGSSRATGSEPEGDIHSKDRLQWLEQHLVEKEEEVVILHKKLIVKDQADVDTPNKSRTTEPSSISTSTCRKPPTVKQSSENTTTTTSEPVSTREPTSNTPIRTEKSVPLLTRSPQVPSKSESPKHTIQPKTTTSHQASSTSRSSSSALISGQSPIASLVSTAQTVPLFSQTLSSVSRLVTDPSPSAQSFEPQSYRNAIMGIKSAVGASPAGFTQRPSSNPPSQSIAFSQPPSSFSSSSNSHPPQTTVWKEQTSVNRGLSFGSVRPESICSSHQWTDDPHRHMNGNARIHNNVDLVSSLRQSQGVMPEEFPHLDIINDLLDEDQSVGRETFDDYYHHHDHHSFISEYTFRRDSVTSEIASLNGSCQFDYPEQYYDEISQRVYDSCVPFHGLRDSHPLQVDLSAYGNGHMDVMIQNQWPIGSADLSMLSFGSNAMDVNGYSYQLLDYSTCDVGGYNVMYGPAAGR